MTAVQTPTRVVFIDDNVLAANALERWFESSMDVRCIGWAADAEAALASVAASAPDVVLLDLDMPGIDTFALIPRLLRARPGGRVVILSGHLRAEDIGRALDAGASGYIAKDEPTAVITALVRRAAAGECVLSPLAQRTYLGEQ